MLDVTGRIDDISAEICVAGGGPAGLVAGYLLAMQGRDVVVLEKHADFLRDFRGDTVHPSTLQLFDDLGLLEQLLALPHQPTERIRVTFNGETFTVADFTRLPTAAKFIAMMPQWDLLDFIADEGRRFPNFRLLMSTEATGLIEEAGRIIGVTANRAGMNFSIRARLTIGADGRRSQLRAASGLEVEDFGAPIDVFWMRLPRDQSDKSAESFGEANRHGMLVLINRGKYWQCALPFTKSTAEEIRAKGIDAFRARIGLIAPDFASAASALTSWDEVKLLSVQVNRLKRWSRDGLVFIGDAAHAMSPIGGVGINLAVQDAVAAARILGGGDYSHSALRRIERRRAFAARLTQRVQLLAQDRILAPIVTSDAPLKTPGALRLIDRHPFLQGLTARAVGIGARPERWRR